MRHSQLTIEIVPHSFQPNPDTYDPFFENMRDREKQLTLGIKSMTEADAKAASHYTASDGGVRLFASTTWVPVTIMGVNFTDTSRTAWRGKLYLGNVIVDYYYDSRTRTGNITFFPE